MHNQCLNTAVIILAGGQSSRAEQIKGLRQVNGDYWIDIQISYFLALGFKQIFIGLGYDHEKYMNLSKFIKQESTEVISIINKNPENGSFSTLKKILTKATIQQWDSAIIMHIDHALPDKNTILALVDQAGFDTVKPSFNGQSGHPIKISRSFCQKLTKKPDTTQLNKEIRKLNINNICWLKVNNNMIKYNLNTHQDWQTYIKRDLCITKMTSKK